MPQWLTELGSDIRHVGRIVTSVHVPHWVLDIGTDIRKWVETLFLGWVWSKRGKVTAFFKKSKSLSTADETGITPVLSSIKVVFQPTPTPTGISFTPTNNFPTGISFQQTK
jgi:hypothetical protein